MWRKTKHWLAVQLRREWLRKHLVFLLLQIGFVLLAWGWFPQERLPLPGYSVAVIAVVAAIMSIHGEMKGWQKAIWLLIIGAFLIVELRAIKQDHEDSKKQASDDRKTQDTAFKVVLDKENKDFAATAGGLAGAYTLSQNQFNATMKQFSATNRDESVRFNALVEEDKKLFAHEEDIAESLSGTLSPGNEPIPPDVKACGGENGEGIREGDIVLLYDDRKILITNQPLPLVVVGSRSKGPLLTLNRSPDGNIFPTGDVRGLDNKIIVRLNSQGYVVNHSGFLEVTKDKHTLTVVDDYGIEIFKVQYLNPRMISISMPTLFARFGSSIRCDVIRDSTGFGGIYGIP